jgi:hypothetical protein
MEKSERPVLVAVLLVTVALFATAAVVPDAQSGPAWGTSLASGTSAVSAEAVSATAHTAGEEITPTDPQPGTEPTAPAEPGPAPVQALPHGANKIFGVDRFLVAYYGTAGTGALGVLGEDDPDRIIGRLTRAAKPFARKGSPTQAVFELIVTIADAGPGKDGDYSHDVARADVQRYIDAAHEHDALLLLDVQPGRANFLDVAKRWGWALKDPYVGLALDPEWRMGKHGVPGRRIGSVGADEVNRTAAWLRNLVKQNSLPQKLFVLHQFRTDMIHDIGRIKPRQGLVMVQHVDGFGTPSQKLDTFHAVARPGQFLMGFKLFYDEDIHRMTAADVRRIRPKVRFVSFQ